MKIHKLKIGNEYLLRLLDGTKTFEIRYNDRDYQVGDILDFGDYQYEVRYILRDFVGLAPGYVAMTITRVI